MLCHVMRNRTNEAGLSAGEILRLRRKKRRLDQTKVGALIDASQARVSRIESGEMRPTLEQAAAIEREFGIPASAWVESERGVA